MIPEPELLEAWQRDKADIHGYRLVAEAAVAFEYRGPQFGHPSNYSAIKIVATPSPNLCLESVAIYSSSVTTRYAHQLLLAVGRAAVDELFAGWYPYRCKLVVDEVGWDEIMSSELAIYRAARGALSKLRQEGKWELII